MPFSPHSVRVIEEEIRRDEDQAEQVLSNISHGPLTGSIRASAHDAMREIEDTAGYVTPMAVLDEKPALQNALSRQDTPAEPQYRVINRDDLEDPTQSARELLKENSPSTEKHMEPKSQEATPKITIERFKELLCSKQFSLKNVFIKSTPSSVTILRGVFEIISDLEVTDITAEDPRAEESDLPIERRVEISGKLRLVRGAMINKEFDVIKDGLGRHAHGGAECSGIDIEVRGKFGAFQEKSVAA